MKLTVQGFEILAGKSAKTGKDYDMSRIHCVIPLQESATAKGYAGTAYQVPAHLIEKIKHLPMPLQCEVEMQDIMRFGKREQQVSSIQPLSVSKG
ncbi:MAG: hypothetical protein Q4A11_00670 [Brachymonas sp.]|nr:hypothetical protein [Brachymonas sp.]